MERPWLHAGPSRANTYDAPVAQPDFERELEILAALREPTRLRLYRLVERAPAPVSRDDAAAAAGISRRLAAFHLDRLVRLGLLSAEYRRLSGRTGPGAGRPSKLYRRSRHDFQLSVPYRDHELLARALAETYGGKSTEIAAVPAAREAGRSLGARGRRRVRAHSAVGGLLDCVQTILESLGFDPYRPSPSEIHLRNCPFAPLSRLHTPLVCGVAMSLVSGIAEGVADDALEVGRDDKPDRCCPVVAMASTGRTRRGTDGRSNET